MKRVLALTIITAIMIVCTSAISEVDDMDFLCTVINCNDYVSLRAQPSSESDQLAKIPLGESVVWLGNATLDFCRVKYADLEGYVLSQYLSEAYSKHIDTAPISDALVTPAEDSATENVTAPTAQRKVINCNEFISLRVSPSTSADRITTIPLGEKVVWIEYSTEGFSLVEYKGKRGYALTSYLSDIITEAPMNTSEIPTDGVDNSDIAGVASTEKSLIEVLPGARLMGLVIGIDPGHQGKENNELELVSPVGSKKKMKVSSGTTGVNSRIPEHVTNLEIAKKLREALVQEGAEVIMSRETADVNISNIERAVMMNEANCDIVLRLHCDGSTDHSVHGITMYVRKTGAKAEESFSAAKTLVAAMANETGSRNRGVVRNNTYTGLNWSEVPSILVEMGFLSNKSEDELLNSPEYQQKLVKGMIEGLAEYFGRNVQ